MLIKGYCLDAGENRVNHIPSGSHLHMLSNDHIQEPLRDTHLARASSEMQAQRTKPLAFNLWDSFQLGRIRKPGFCSSMGFTLVELLVAIAILGILCAIAIPSYRGYREKAMIAQAQADIKSIQTAIEMLAIDTEKWPGPNEVGLLANQEVWDLGSPAAGLIATNGQFPNWNGPYLDTVLKDPWGNNYFFDPDYSINGKTYTVVGSFGPNGQGPNLYDFDDVVLILPAS